MAADRLSVASTRRPDATGQTYRQLSERIASGELRPGTRLKEAALAESLGVSRTPVREALRRLAADGVVEVHPNRGAQLISYSPEEIADMFSVRVELEPRATALAVPRLDDEGLDRLQDLAEQMTAIVRGDRGQRDMQLLGELNRTFHTSLIEASGNKALASAVAAVTRPAVVHRTFHLYSDTALARSMAHHSELIAAARVRDADWAEAVMRAHILAARHTATDL